MRVERDVTVSNKLGLHARAAAKLVQLAEQYSAEITVKRGELSANAKSIMGIMLLSAHLGVELKLVAQGSDAKAALEAILELFARKFDEAQ